MEDLTSNQKLRPIIDDNEGDVALWNKEIAKFFQGKDFMNAPWLFAEAYKYRRLRECFSVSKHWRVRPCRSHSSSDRSIESGFLFRNMTCSSGESMISFFIQQSRLNILSE